MNISVHIVWGFPPSRFMDGCDSEELTNLPEVSELGTRAQIHSAQVHLIFPAERHSLHTHT